MCHIVIPLPVILITLTMQCVPVEEIIHDIVCNNKLF